MKNEIIQFLRENIIGKTLLTGAVYKLENGNLEGVYNDKMTFSNLVTTENGFKFNMTTVTQEQVYNLDDKGARTTIAKDYTGTSVFCYELAMRKSTKQITHPKGVAPHQSRHDSGGCLLQLVPVARDGDLAVAVVEQVFQSNV